MNLLFISVQEIIQIWDKLIFTPQPTLTICVLRVLVGFLMLIESCQLLIFFQKHISADGYFNYSIYKKLLLPTRFSVLGYLPGSNASVKIILTIQLCSALFLILGFFPQIAAFVCFIIATSIYNRNPYISDSGDTVRRYLCLFLIFAPIQTQLIAGDLNHFIKPDVSGWPWCLFLIQFFIANIYMKNVLFKLLGRTWRNGTATKELLGIRIWNRFELPEFLNKNWFYEFTTYGTILIEMLLFTLIWVDDFRPYVLIIGILFHLGLWFFLKVGFFQITMIFGLLSFITTTEYFRFLRWVGIV